MRAAPPVERRGGAFILEGLLVAVEICLFEGGFVLLRLVVNLSFELWKHVALRRSQRKCRLCNAGPPEREDAPCWFTTRSRARHAAHKPRRLWFPLFLLFISRQSVAESVDLNGAISLNMWNDDGVVGLEVFVLRGGGVQYMRAVDVPPYR